MRTIKIGKYRVHIHEDGNIICECIHGSLYPGNFIKGEKVCKHIKEAIKVINIE